MSIKGSLFVVSAPSGTGKTSLMKALTKAIPNLCVSISYTTRLKRPEEQDNVDYHFINKDRFESMLKKGEFLEHAQVFGNFYGTSLHWVEETRCKGLDVILEIDWQGAKQVRARFVETQSIYILPLSHEILIERLQKRHPNNLDIIEERMSEAKSQIAHYDEYDYLVFNDQFEQALEDLKSIIRTHRLQWRRQQAERKSVLKDLLS